MQQQYRAYLFDMDGTLAKTRTPIELPMAMLLCAILERGALVGVVSGSEFELLVHNVVEQLPCKDTYRERIFLLPTTGSRMYEYRNDEYHTVFAYCLAPEEKKEIQFALEALVARHPEWFPAESFGPRIDDRDTQMTLAGLGRDAPRELKIAWDTDRKKRDQLVLELHELLPGYVGNAGGTTSIDVTKRGVDKEMGINVFLQHTGLTPQEVVFAGDAIYEGGTDYPAVKTGVDTLPVKSPEDLLAVLPSYVDRAAPWKQPGVQ